MANWVLLSLVALLGFGVVNTGLKYISRGDPVEVSFFIYLSATVATGAVLLLTGRDVALDTVSGVAAALGLFSLVATVAAIIAVADAPNPGYVAAIFSTNVVLVALISPHLFGTRLSGENLVGILLAVFAIYLITR